MARLADDQKAGPPGGLSDGLSVSEIHSGNGGDGSAQRNTNPSINITFNDLLGSRDVSLCLPRTSDGVKNLTICFGNHQITNPSITSTPSSLLGIPSNSNFDTSPSSRECTGFPTGYFRIRAAGTQYYWTLHHGESSHDGNALCLWHLNDGVPPTQIFYLNQKGDLCCGGCQIDVIGNALVIAHNRSPTLPWPNPWSHLLPTFSYSKETKIITVTFYSDPSVSKQWPRPDKEWKGKEFVIAARSTSDVRVPHLNEIARWALNPRFMRWTARAGDKWGANEWNNLGVEDFAESGDTDRIRWEIEQA